FETARRISHESHTGGQVSPHVSEILSQLAVKYWNQAAEKGIPQGSFRKNSGTRKATTNARATVLSYHRNFKEESASDRTIREENEKRLREKAEKLKHKKVSRKK